MDNWKSISFIPKENGIYPSWDGAALLSSNMAHGLQRDSMELKHVNLGLRSGSIQSG